MIMTATAITMMMTMINSQDCIGKSASLRNAEKDTGHKMQRYENSKETFANINEHKIQNYKKGVVNYLATKNTQKLKAINLSEKKLELST